MPKPMVITIDEPEWDIATCDRLAEIIAPAFGHRHVVIDLSAVEYMDSTCLTKFVEMFAERVMLNGYPPCHLVIRACFQSGLKESVSIRRNFLRLCHDIASRTSSGRA